MYHTMPADELAEHVRRRHAERGTEAHVCQLPDCSRPTWDGKPGYCCRRHQKKARWGTSCTPSPQSAPSRLKGRRRARTTESRRS